jgi:hypothetical protein
MISGAGGLEETAEGGPSGAHNPKKPCKIKVFLDSTAFVGIGFIYE